MDPSAVGVRPGIDAVLDADHLVVTTLLPVLLRHDLSIEVFRALALLGSTNGATVGEIAARTGATPSSTTRLVDRLVERSLAYRRTARADRRQVVLALSDSGRDLWSTLSSELS